MGRLMNCKHGLLKIVFLSLLALTSAAVNAAKNPDPFEMAERMDAIDKQDFQAAIERATSCTSARNFSCAESELTKAAKAVNNGKDKKTLLASRQNLVNERQELANEIRREEEARRREEEERQARIRREEEAERDRAREERRRSAEEAEESSYSASNDIGLYILQKGQENAAFLNRIDRQTIAALNESNRIRAAQAAERERARAEWEERAADRRREAEHRREAARERAAREAAERSARATVVASATELPKYQPPVVTIPKGRETCPPGSSPARQANGQYVTIPPSAYCIKDPQSASGSGSSPPSGSDRPLSASATTTRPPTSSSSGGNTGSDAPRSPTTVKQPPKIEWGPIQLEAFAICRQSEKNGKWWCDGPGQNLILFDSPTVEDALDGVGCSSATSAAGARTKDGKPAELYRCGFGLRSFDRNIAKIHGVVTAPRSYMCPKYQGAKCTDFYDGQDKR